MTFSHVEDQTNSGYYTIGSTATGSNGEFGTTTTVQIDVSNANQIIINPVATIAFNDGSEVRCKEEDLRRLRSLKDTLTEIEIPCDGEFPSDAEDATVTVVDDHK